MLDFNFPLGQVGRTRPPNQPRQVVHSLVATSRKVWVSDHKALQFRSPIWVQHSPEVLREHVQLLVGLELALLFLLLLCGLLALVGLRGNSISLKRPESQFVQNIFV